MMDDRQKGNAPKVDHTALTDLIRLNVASNEKRHRRQYFTQNNIRTSEFDSSNQGTRRFTQNSKSTPKPLLECLKLETLLVSKPRGKFKPNARRSNNRLNTDHSDDEKNNSNMSPEKIDFDRSTVDIREPTVPHVLALQKAFDKILRERSLSANSLDERQLVFKQLQKLIADVQPGSKFNLYGSIYFECCLEKPGIMDIDIQLKEESQCDPLSVILDIIKKSDLCKEAKIDAEHKPSCIHAITKEPNIHVKITSGYTRGIYLSKLIRQYIKFDSRVLRLLRLFRILAKQCNIDRTDIGTLHPVVFHIMVIHFLQQLDEPVLPCLHEYAYGIDHVPITLNDNQYPQFFSLCEEYSHKWKSKNTTSVEMLFLQLLSYYVKTFCTKQFVVSIQTRMPIVKVDKNWRSAKLLVEDPIDIRRGLCQTMQSLRSVDYFRSTLNGALNYFARKQKRLSKIISNRTSISNSEDDFVEVVSDDLPTDEPKNSLHNSYKLFYKRLPATVARDVNIKQERVRKYYKNSFENPNSTLFCGVIQVNSSNDKSDEFFDSDAQEAFQHDIEDNFETMDENDNCLSDNDSHSLLPDASPNDDDEQFSQDAVKQQNDEQVEITTETSSSINIDEQQSLDDESQILKDYISQEHATTDNDEQSSCKIETSSSVDKMPTSNVLLPCENNLLASSTTLPIPIEKPILTINDEQIPSPFTSPIKLEYIIDNKQSTIDNSTNTDNSDEFYYDFMPENFNAEQGAPFVCGACNGVGHLKHECPELIIPSMNSLPVVSEAWKDILSKLCRQVTERLKPKDRDIEKRRSILDQLEKQFQKDYPDCTLYAFGSYYNGFGFENSDLDVCLVFKDGREHCNTEVIQIMQGVLRVVRSSNLFEDVRPILQAKVPIIRTIHKKSKIEIDISLHNMLAIENTRLLKMYADIDERVSQLGYMAKHLAKLCGIGDASRGTLSSYAYIIMVIHFLQQIQPPVLPVLQKLQDSNNKPMYKKCSQWNVYFFQDLSELRKYWNAENSLSVGELWLEFLCFYAEKFNYDEYVVTIRQPKPLFKNEKGWLKPTIAIEDPFELSHNLAGGLSLRNWVMIRRVFIRARQHFAVQPNQIDLSSPDMLNVEETLFDVYELCPLNAPKRCEWCKGPYHIRKRCPKLATLANEDRNRKQEHNFQRRPKAYNSSVLSSTNESQQYPNAGPRYYQSRSTVTAQQSSLNMNGYAWKENSDFRNTVSAQSNARFSKAEQSSKKCYFCQSTSHLIADCPTKRKGIQRRNH